MAAYLNGLLLLLPSRELSAAPAFQAVPPSFTAPCWLLLLLLLRQLLCWCQEVLDPSVGESVVATMKREVHRMELRYAELQRTQERLMQVMAGACDSRRRRSSSSRMQTAELATDAHATHVRSQTMRAPPPLNAS